MKFNLKSLLKDKNVLYVVFFLAVVNLFGYLMVGDTESVIFFLVVGFLATYFSKNMIVVLVASMLLTNLLLASKHVGKNVKEGFKEGVIMKDKNPKEPKPGDKHDDDDTEALTMPSGPSNDPMPTPKITKKTNKEKMSKLSPASVNGDDKPNVDYASTVEAAYDNIDKLLNSEALQNMSTDTQRLAEKQNQLQQNIGKLEPMMQKAGALLEGLDMEKISGMISGLGSKLDKMKKK